MSLPLRVPLCFVAYEAIQIEAYYNEYKKASGDIDAQTRWSNQLTWEIARHSIGEELVVYPLLEEALGDKGKQLADEDRSDHQVRPRCMLACCLTLTNVNTRRLSRKA